LEKKRLKNQNDAGALAAGTDAAALMRTLAVYRRPSSRRGLLELSVTAAALAGLWALMWLSLGVGYWLTLLLAVPAAFFLVRMFLIQHDCGHGAFFRHKAVNDWVGRALGVLTLTPYDFWRRTHAIHHATSGNLDRRGIGDIETLTVEEYLALPRYGRLGYRLYRHPLVMFGIGPAYLFVLQFRLPVGFMRKGWRSWVSPMLTNAAIVLVVTAMIWLVGLGPFLQVHLPVTLLAASIGVWLFYVQHQFEGVMWSRDGRWTLHEAALTGSSHYDLPGVLRWLTANIGLHHIHHASSSIPYYRLNKVLHDHPELHAASRVTLGESLRCVRLALWDEARDRLVSFRELRGKRDSA